MFLTENRNRPNTSYRVALNRQLKLKTWQSLGNYCTNPMRSTTISGGYLTLQRQLHENPNYGVASISYAPIVAQVVARSNARSISDYGAGKQNLKKALDHLGVGGYDYHPFDPAFPEYGDPQPADLVCCIDVLEHIEPEFLDTVIAELARITVKFGFFTIAQAPPPRHSLMAATLI